MYRILSLLIISVCLISCKSTTDSAGSLHISSLTFLHEYSLPTDLSFENTVVGGLSGIDYDAEKDLYYLISDDASEINPARFYTAKIKISSDTIEKIEFIKTTFLLDQMGKNYPNLRKNPAMAPDPEALRFFKSRSLFVWSSEGQRVSTGDSMVVQNPAIFMADSSGRLRDSLFLPPAFRMQKSENGPRRNGGFEGLTFSGDLKYLYVSMEEPLYEDGPRAAPDTPSVVRILKFDLDTKKAVAQYAYPIDAVAVKPVPEDAFKINGIADILWLNENELLVIERSFSVGTASNSIKIYMASLENADDVSSIKSLAKDSSYRPMTKKLLFNMDQLGRYIDNIEGVTIGPALSNGKKSLLFVSDNNFNKSQKSQFLLFQINE